MLLFARMLRWHRPWMAVWLLASLLLSPTLGQLHAVTHAPLHVHWHALGNSTANSHVPAATQHPMGPHALAAPSAADAPHAHATALATSYPTTVLERLFADHTLLDCLTLDQLSLGDTPPTYAPPSTLMLPAALALGDAASPARHVRFALAWARAPPSRAS